MRVCVEAFKIWISLNMTGIKRTYIPKHICYLAQVSGGAYKEFFNALDRAAIFKSWYLSYFIDLYDVHTRRRSFKIWISLIAELPLTVIKYPKW